MDFKNTLLIAFLFVGLNTFAQNRLEFNRIVSLSGSIAGGSTLNLDTVPVGKTYKITAFKGIGKYVTFIINNITHPIHDDSQDFNFQFPVWLKEGDVVGVQNCYYNSGTGYHISAIEFNIVTD
tara:strand:+ start:654 stop:1022 length:369 start_codon:yes stop_codon:yes gene_type:complete